jgi:hypothetical protein
MELFLNPIKLLLATAKDVLPVLGLLVLFQMVVLKRPLPRPGRIIFGFCLVLVGMACFWAALTWRFSRWAGPWRCNCPPACQSGGKQIWAAYGWIYLFAFLVGFSTTIAEPSLIAVANKAEEASYKAVSSLGLRIAVALGVPSASPSARSHCHRNAALYLYSCPDMWLWPSKPISHRA